MRTLLTCKLGLILWCTSTLPGFAQEDELLAIQKTVTLYFEGMMERKVDKLEKAFFSEARLIGYRGETMTVTDFKDWSQGFKKGDPRDPKEYINTLVGIEIQGYTAIAKTELFWPGVYYYDYLTLIKIEGSWKIVHKTWFEKPLPLED